MTDAGLVHLEGLRNLKLLEVGETKVTAEGKHELLKSLPACKFHNVPIF